MIPVTVFVRLEENTSRQGVGNLKNMLLFFLLFSLGKRRDKGNTNQTIPSLFVHPIFRGFKGDIIPSLSDSNTVKRE